MRGGVAGVGADGHFQRGAGLVQLVLVGIQHGQVVVGLGQLWVIFRQLGERGHGVCRLARVGLGHTLEKAQLRIAGRGRQSLVRLGQGFGRFASLEQLRDFGIVVGLRLGSTGTDKGRQCQQAQ